MAETNRTLVKFYQTTNTNLSSLPITAGQLIFVTDTKRLYLDQTNSNRIEISSYNLIQDGTDTHKLIFTDPSGTSHEITMPDNNTTYLLEADTTNKQIKLTPSSGSAQSITVPYATEASVLKNTLAGSGTVASTNIIEVTGSSDGFKLNYASTTADTGVTALTTTDDANARLSLGNTVSNNYKEAISIVNGIPSAPTADAGTNTDQIATTSFVKTAIDNLPEPMVFKGSLGTDGTITDLPVDGSADVGDTYKVITAGVYASQNAKIGDTFICLTKTSNANTWELIPSGDEPSGTVTSIVIKATSPIAVNSTSAITTSGTRTISHANSGVTAGTYTSVTVNETGHVTGGTNPTTISGYGITDAKLENGTITLGSETITPLTAASTLDATKLSGTIPTACYTNTKNTAGSTDTSSKIYLIGATSQAANPQTYSDNEIYATDGVLTTKSVQVGGTAATMQYNSTDKCIEFIFA